jgi:hypothetical protein
MIHDRHSKTKTYFPTAHSTSLEVFDHLMFCLRAVLAIKVDFEVRGIHQGTVTDERRHLQQGEFASQVDQVQGICPQGLVQLGT